DIIRCFLNSNRKANCSKLLKYLKINNQFYKGKEILCERCFDNNWVPSKCSHYKTIKGRIDSLKSKIELIGIGTIVVSASSQIKIRDQGWIFRFFEGVRAVVN
ncbi:unnamed protein product, partial [marine sediment metagenome]